MQDPYERKSALESQSALLGLLCSAAMFLWKDWPLDMQVVIAVEESTGAKVRLRGACPHCRTNAAFTEAGHFHYMEPIRDGEHKGWWLHYSVLQCQGCLDFILGVVKVYEAEPAGGRGVENKRRYHYIYVKHYPVGAPDDSVSEDVPKDIRVDFSEALRCRWVNGYNATVEMCRRALESSCIQLGAPLKLGTLEKMIDWVAEQGKITKPLQEMAHKIRLGGDRGAHPSVRVMGEEDADAVIEFTKEYLDHVYVMPAKMAKFDFSRPKQLGAATVGEVEK